jgi:phosphocarrier protein HPr
LGAWVQKQEVVIVWKQGLHSRPATRVVTTANKFDCQVTIKNSDMEINAKSIISLISLGATFKTRLTIVTEGEDEKEAMEALVACFSDPDDH